MHPVTPGNRPYRPYRPSKAVFSGKHATGKGTVARATVPTVAWNRREWPQKGTVGTVGTVPRGR